MYEWMDGIVGGWEDCSVDEGWFFGLVVGFVFGIGRLR